MKEKRTYAGSYKNTSTSWGQLVASDQLVSHKDNMLGIYGIRDSLVMEDAYSGFKYVYLLPDNTVDSTMDAIKHFQGDRVIERFYSNRSGEIDRARGTYTSSLSTASSVYLRTAVAERLVRDVLEGTRTVLARAGLPPRFWEYACRHSCMMDKCIT